MGVSLLGLASQSKARIEESPLVDWEECNFIGVDLSRLGIRYADGVCSRWDLSYRLKFVVDSAEDCLSRIKESYPGDVEVSEASSNARFYMNLRFNQFASFLISFSCIACHDTGEYISYSLIIILNLKSILANANIHHTSISPVSNTISIQIIKFRGDRKRIQLPTTRRCIQQ